MGFYLRKAIKVGPLRFNLSKSGIGVSAGVKGLRFGTGPRGNYVHMGRGGLYFRQSLGPAGRSTRTAFAEPPLSPPQPPASVGPLEDIESSSVLEMVDGSSGELVAELNEKRKRMRFLPGAVVLSAILLYSLASGSQPPWLLVASAAACAGLCWMVSAQDALRKTTVIFYNLESDVEQSYQKLHDAFGQLRSCGYTWHVESRGDVRDRKYHAGAGSVVKRKQVSLQIGQPPLVKTNIEVPLIPVGKQTLAFMPDRLLVFEPKGVGAVNYRDLAMERAETRFVEEDSVAQDATVVDRTWRYINKKGGPDRRFKDNRELPICVYDQLRFASTSGLNEVIQLSRKGAGANLDIALGGMRRLSLTEQDQPSNKPPKALVKPPSIK